MANFGPCKLEFPHHLPNHQFILGVCWSPKFKQRAWRSPWSQRTCWTPWTNVAACVAGSPRCPLATCQCCFAGNSEMIRGQQTILILSNGHEFASWEVSGLRQFSKFPNLPIRWRFSSTSSSCYGWLGFPSKGRWSPFWIVMPCNKKRYFAQGHCMILMYCNLPATTDVVSCNKM